MEYLFLYESNSSSIRLSSHFATYIPIGRFEISNEACEILFVKLLLVTTCPLILTISIFFTSSIPTKVIIVFAGLGYTVT